MTRSQSSEEAPPAEVAEAESFDPWCEFGEVTDELEFTFGDVEVVSDDRAQLLGLEWRHYVPTTVTNTSDKACIFKTIILVNTDSEDSKLNDVIDLPLKPGQSAQLQLFNLKGETDTKDSAPEVGVDPQPSYGLKNPLLVDYYETEFEVTPGSGNDGETQTFELSTERRWGYSIPNASWQAPRTTS